MYSVSEAFLQAVQENTRKYYWTGRIVTKAGAVHEFGNENIVKGSGYISSQCCGSAEIEIGTVYAAEMGITLFSEIDRYTLEDAKVELFYHLRVGGGSFEEVPMGIFEVSEANRTLHCLEIKAYDYMLRFEKSFNGIETVGNAYAFLALCCKACDVELAHNQAEIEAMPNGSEMLSVYTENDIETYRDVLFYVGQVLGGFFRISREGKLELIKYGNRSVVTVSDRHRFSSSFSDFITRYTAVSSTNIKTQIAEYYALEPDDGLTMNLGVNPLLQFGLEETRKALLENILTDLSVIRYVPFDSDTIGNPALDLGDVLVFSGGHADESQMACVTGFQIKINGKHSLKCVGKNPRLALAKSKNDKNISGLLNQIEAGKIGIHTFTNASAYSVGGTDTKIISIEFAAAEETHVQFFAMVLVDVEAEREEQTGTASGTIVAIKTVKHTITELDRSKIEEQKKAVRAGYEMDIIPSDLATYGKDAKNLLKELQSQNERVVKDKAVNPIKYTVFFKAKDADAISQVLADYAAKQVKNNLFGIREHHIGQILDFHCPIKHGKESLYYGLNALSNNLIMVDRKKLKNPNGLILGTPGSGKSFAAKREIANAFLVTDDDVIISDPESEYSPLVQRFGGQVIKISPTSSQYINPMDINMNYSDEDSPIALKADFILSLCELIVGGKEGLQPVEKTVIDRCIHQIYQRYFENPDPEKMPLLA